MRAYFIGNMYLSSIQQGIQALHCLEEMHVKYKPVVSDYECATSSEHRMLYEWGEDHKTVVLLNGGFSSSLLELYMFMESEQNPYPFAKFHEGQDALDGALTCVGIILDDKIYEGAKKIRTRLDPIEFQDWKEQGILHIEVEGVVARYFYTEWEKDLMTRLNCMRLAQ